MCSSSLTDFLRHLILQPPAARDIPVVSSYSDEKARAFLADVATRYDVPPRPPAPQNDTLSVTPGRPGHLLNIVESMPALDAPSRSVSNWSPIITAAPLLQPARDRAISNIIGEGLPMTVARFRLAYSIALTSGPEAIAGPVLYM